MRNCMTAFGLLVLRLGMGAYIAFGHGWDKIQNYNNYKDTFGQPVKEMFGISNAWCLNLAIGAEFGCAILVMVGLITRIAALPLIATMCIAAFVVHKADPWFLYQAEDGVQAKELALLYAVPFVSLFFTGPGPISLDGLIFRRRKPPQVQQRQAQAQAQPPRRPTRPV